MKVGRLKHISILSQKIHVFVAETMDKVAESTWLFKSENNSVIGLADKLRKYGSDISLAKEIYFTLEVDEAVINYGLNLMQQKNCFLIGKEAINNAVKYADCSQIEVLFDAIKNGLRILIKDNGIGINSTLAQQGNGMKNMQQRAAEMGAVCIVASNQDAGTTITLTLNS